MFRQISLEVAPGSMLVHSRRASRSLPPAEAAKSRRRLVPSPDGRRFFTRPASGYWEASLVDAKTGESLFSGTIFRFSPTGRFFVTRHSQTEFGIRRADDIELVCQLESGPLPHAVDPLNLRFTPDDQRVFFATHEGTASHLIVFDLDAERELVERHIDGPYFRIRNVYSGSTYLLSRGINDPDLGLFNWRTGETEHRFDLGCRMLQVSPDDRAIAYVSSKPASDERTPDVHTLYIEELSPHCVLKKIELPCKPKELRFLSGGEVVMAIVELSVWDHRRNVALLYGVTTDGMDGETVSWTPARP